MTVADQLKHDRKKSWLEKIMLVLVLLMAATVPLLAIFLSANVNDTRDVTDRVDTALEESIVSICRSRTTTLRTAPQTVKEIRAVIDAESTVARKVCPDLDYPQLKLDREAEAAKLRSGADPNKIAIQGQTGSTGKAGKDGPAGAAGARGTAGPVGVAGPAGPTGVNGRNGAAGSRGPAGAQGPTGPAGPSGPAGPAGPAGPRGQ